MRNLWTVAEFTIKDMLKRKSFIISMIIILAFIVVGFNIPRIIELFQGESNWNTKVLIIDEENIFEGEPVPFDAEFYEKTKDEQWGYLTRGLQLSYRRVGGTILEKDKDTEKYYQEAKRISEALKE